VVKQLGSKMTDVKKCKKCGIEKELNCFSLTENKNNGQSYYIHSCKECIKADRYNTIKEKERQNKKDLKALGMKKCIKCKIERELNIDNFHWRKDRNKWENQCNICTKTNRVKNYQENKEEIKMQQKIFYQENIKDILDQKAQYYLENKKEIREKQAHYYQENKEEIRDWQAQYSIQPEFKIKRNTRIKNRRVEDIFFRLRTIISSAIWEVLQRNGSSKAGNSCLKYLSYTFEELKQHIENQFEWWMNWNNQGVYNSKVWDDLDPTTWTWQLDHITPQSDLPYITMEEDNFKKAWALDNLRPYSAKQNVLDGITRIRHSKKG
jgi:hypothetical protein